jgi:hypothetical protein
MKRDTQHSGAQCRVSFMLIVENKQGHYAECCYAECRYAECHYAECRYAECHYAECRYAACRGALFTTQKHMRTIL